MCRFVGLLEVPDLVVPADPGRVRLPPHRSSIAPSGSVIRRDVAVALVAAVVAAWWVNLSLPSPPPTAPSKPSPPPARPLIGCVVLSWRSPTNANSALPRSLSPPGLPPSLLPSPTTDRMLPPMSVRNGGDAPADNPCAYEPSNSCGVGTARGVDRCAEGASSRGQKGEGDTSSAAAAAGATAFAIVCVRSTARVCAPCMF
jgi:hypothetical protein